MLNNTKFISESILSEFELQLRMRLKDRNALMLLLAVRSGARATELISLTKSSINIDSRTVLIKGIKNSNDREIPIDDDLCNALILYTKEMSSQDKLFPISYPRLHQIWSSLRPCNAKLHALRHNFALRLYTKSKDIRLVQQALGHKSITSTECYQTYVYTQSELRKYL